MNSSNPYESPTEDNLAPHPASLNAALLGTVTLLAGLLVMAYGAIAFWVIPTLPPNGGEQGRLPSVYFLGGGIVTAIVGLIMRSLTAGKPTSATAACKSKGISATYGILILAAVLGGAFYIITKM